MIRSAGAAAIVFSLLPAGPQKSQAPPAASPDLVPIYATVLDADGRPVTGLMQADFELLDDGKPRPIAHFASVAPPASVFVMADMSGSMTPGHGVVHRWRRTQGAWTSATSTNLASHLARGTEGRIGSN